MLYWADWKLKFFSSREEEFVITSLAFVWTQNQLLCLNVFIIFSPLFLVKQSKKNNNFLFELLEHIGQPRSYISPKFYNLTNTNFQLCHMLIHSYTLDGCDTLRASKHSHDFSTAIPYAFQLHPTLGPLSLHSSTHQASSRPGPVYEQLTLLSNDWILWNSVWRLHAWNDLHYSPSYRRCATAHLFLVLSNANASHRKVNQEDVRNFMLVV
jgi:hypothetical protein